MSGTNDINCGTDNGGRSRMKRDLREIQIIKFNEKMKISIACVQVGNYNHIHSRVVSVN